MGRRPSPKRKRLKNTKENSSLLSYKMNRKKTDRLAACRVFYAKMAAAGGGQLREDLERAFEIVPREYFLGAGPWFAVSSLSGMVVVTPTDDPIHVYQNVLFALDRQKRINNG